MRPAAFVAAILTTLLLAPGLAAAASCHRLEPAKPAESDEKISEFGKYQGYSKPVYDSWVRLSLYVEVRDGGKLATDVMIPAIDCQQAKEPLPVLWTYTPYKRADINDDGSVGTAVEDQGAEELIRHGYIIAAVAIRGTAASFGRYHGLFSPTETRDAYDIVEWLAAQPWSNGKIGMVGGSYQGITQLMVAGLNPPHLEAIFPLVSIFDFYYAVYPGGVLRDGLWDRWAQLRHGLDVIAPSVPVDDDPNGLLLETAKSQHASNWPVMPHLRAAAFRDYDQPEFAWARNSPSARLEAINRAAIPMYISDGWNDMFTADVLFWFENYAGPKKMMIGPWTHNSKRDPQDVVDERNRLTTTEEHRWFDYWLKGIENGVMDGPAVNYSVLTGPEMAHVWRESAAWPPPGIGSQTYHLAKERTLASGPPAPTEGSDAYRLDYTTTTGPNSRWNAVFGFPLDYPDMTANDKKSLSYTSEPLAADTEIIGFPVVTLYVSSTANDGDFHALLERVDGKGVSHYVSEGILRASQRKRRPAPWKNFGLPYHSHAKADVQTLSPGEVVELEFFLLATATTFKKGDRVRLAIMGADADNTESLLFEEIPTVTLHYGGERKSSLVLPVRQ